MKWLKFYKNKWNIALTILSLLSLIPFFFFLRNAKKLNDLQDITHANDAMIKNTLSQSLSNPYVLVPFIVGIIIWASAAIVAAIAIDKKQTRGWFGIISLFLGGMGLHLILSPIVLISKRKTKGNGKTLLYVGSSLGLIATIAPVAFILSKKTNDSPVVASPIKLSLNNDSPNLIEIFADGLDIHSNKDEWTNNKDLKDFTLFDKFMTSGHPTHLSLPMLNGDFDKNNPFYLMDHYKVGAEKYMDQVYADAFIKSIDEHMKVDNATFNARVLVNPINYAKTANYGPSVSGNAKEIQSLDKDLQVTNWSGARDSISSPWGISSLSPDGDSYKWVSKNLQANADKTAKGSRVYLEDLITHRPFLNSSNGTFSTFNFDYQSQVKFFMNNLKDMMDSLKETGAYDNTMIIIYGDHASHDYAPNEATEMLTDVRKSESAMFIKYPHTKEQSKMNVVSDRYIYGPQINSIISDYFNNVKSFDQTNYFAQSKFDNKPRPLFGQPDHYVLASWTGEKITTDETSEVIYNQNSIAAQLQTLSNLRGGDF